MPSYRTHLLGGLIIAALSIVIVVFLGFYDGDHSRTAILVAICALGALFPDIDTDSKGQTVFYLAFLVLDLWLVATQRFELAAWLGLLAVVPVVGQHRGWIHSWWAMLLLPLPIVLVPWLVFSRPWEIWALIYTAFVLGYFSHLLLDRTFR